MPRYIDADLLMKELGITDPDCEKCAWGQKGFSYCTRDGDFVDACVAICDAPTADVVEVVRCKECVRRDICRTTNIWAVTPRDDWFCADGER